MKITKIFPRGYCYGVIRAIMMTKKISKEHQGDSKQIYMIGMLVHNRHIVNDIEKLGVILLDDTNTSRLDLVKKLDPEKSILIFTAHGTPISVIEYVKKHKFIYYDTVCPEVIKTFDIIEEKIKGNYDIIFLGVKKHPETLAVKEINKKRIHLITEISQLDNLEIKNKLAVLNQTTLSSIDLENFYNKIKQKWPQVELYNDLCKATLDRQKPLFNIDPTVDLVIVCGDKKSNNSNALMNIAKDQGFESILINNPEDLPMNIINKKRHIAITAGASTPTYITNKIISICADV